MASRFFRPGHFGFFVIVEGNEHPSAKITRHLQYVSNLQIKSVEWVDLGMNLIAILFSSFRPQIYITEWQQIFRCGMFQISNDQELLRSNSKHVVRIIADARQTNPLSIHQFQVNHTTLFWQQWEDSGCFTNIRLFFIFRSPSTRRRMHHFQWQIRRGSTDIRKRQWHRLGKEPGRRGAAWVRP